MSVITVVDATAHELRYAIPYAVAADGTVRVAFPDSDLPYGWRVVGTVTDDGNRVSIDVKGHTDTIVTLEAPSVEQVIVNALAYKSGSRFYRAWRFCILPGETVSDYVTRNLRTWELLPTLRRGYGRHSLNVDVFDNDCRCDGDVCECEGYWQARCTCSWRGSEHDNADSACSDDERHFSEVLRTAYADAKGNGGITLG